MCCFGCFKKQGKMLPMLDYKAIRGSIAKFCAHYDYPEEATATFLDVFDKIVSNESALAKFKEPIAKYAAGLPVMYRLYVADGIGSLTESVAKLIGASKRAVDFVFYLCLTPFLEKRYENSGIDKQIYWDSMLDFKCKLQECKRVYNEWGTFVAGWFGGFFDMNRFALGRLQYEVRRVNVPFVCGGKLIINGRKFVNIHIPSSGALTEESVKESFKKAYAFFKPRLKRHKIVFLTDSWLLNKAHRDILPPSSNMIKFMDNFKVVGYIIEPDNGDYWRIFGAFYDRKKLPPLTGGSRLQNGYAKILADGGHIYRGRGAFLFDGEKIYNN